jgi:zinc protease
VLFIRLLVCSALGAAVFLASPGGVRRAAAEDATAPATTKKLGNGLTLIFLEDHNLPVVSIRLTYQTAPSPDGLQFIAPRLILDATTHIAEGRYDALLGAAGGRNMDWSIFRGNTSFTVAVPAHRIDLPLWLWSDQMAFALPRIDEPMLERAKALALQDHRMRWDERPCGIAEAATQGVLYPSPHPYHAAVLGPTARGMRASVAELRRFLDDNFAPNRASLAFVGDFDTADLEARVRKWFGAIPAGAPPEVPTDELLPAQQTTISARANIDAPSVLIQWRIPRAWERPFDWEVLQKLLDGSETALLPWELRDRQALVTSITARYDRRPFGSVFSVNATVAHGHSAEEVSRAIDAYLKALVLKPPSPQNVDWASRAANRARILGRETTTERVTFLGNAWAYAMPWSLPDEEKVDVSRPSALLRKALLDEHRTIVRCEVDPSAPIAGVISATTSGALP